MVFSTSIRKALIRCPLWSLTAGVILGVTIADSLGSTWWWYGVCGGAALSLCIRRKALHLFLLGAVLAHGLHGRGIDRQKSWLKSLDHQYQIRPAQISGIIIDTGTNGKGPYLVKVTSPERNHNLQAGVHILLYTPKPYPHPNSVITNLQYGDKIQVKGNLTPIPKARNPHEFDRARWLHRQGANLIMQANTKVQINGVNSLRRPLRMANKWRIYLRQQMTIGLDEVSQEAQLIRAVVLGERPPQPSAMLENFRHSGTLHVFAVSGLHVGMVGTIISLALWFLRVPRWLLITLTILGMLSYAGITGLRPPSVRAVIMATVFLSGFLIQRRPTLINSLAASATAVLLWDGHQLFTPGFQLSYGVLLSLALLAGMWARVLKPMAEIDPFMPHLLLTSWQETQLNIRKWLKNSISISMAAWMGSAPLMWIHFGIITPIAIIAGIPLMLMVFLILAITMLSLAISPIWQPAGSAINQVNATIAKATYHSATFFANLPGSHFYKHPSTSENQKIIVFDLPYGGGATLINLGGGILLDSGKQSHFQRHVRPSLEALKSSPDSLIISHADVAHCGGMSAHLTQFQPKQAIIPRAHLRSPSYKDFLSKATYTNCKLIIPQHAQTFQIQPGIFLEILHAPAELDGYGLADDTGLVIKLHWHGWRILFTGDAGFITETRLLESDIDLGADLIIMGRNADDYSGTLSFINAVSPQAIISTNTDFPLNERIPEQWRELLQNKDIHLLDQQRTGAVTITLKKGNLTLTPTISNVQPLTLPLR